MATAYKSKKESLNTTHWTRVSQIWGAIIRVLELEEGPSGTKTKFKTKGQSWPS
jgi:hypothetical protein